MKNHNLDSYISNKTEVQIPAWLFGAVRWRAALLLVIGPERHRKKCKTTKPWRTRRDWGNRLRGGGGEGGRRRWRRERWNFRGRTEGSKRTLGVHFDPIHFFIFLGVRRIFGISKWDFLIKKWINKMRYKNDGKENNTVLGWNSECRLLWGVKMLLFATAKGVVSILNGFFFLQFFTNVVIEFIKSWGLVVNINWGDVERKFKSAWEIAGEPSWVDLGFNRSAVALKSIDKSMSYKRKKREKRREGCWYLILKVVIAWNRDRNKETVTCL